MLEPQSRTLLFNALQPDESYSLDFAVGTTYSLDLVALLTAPLAFTFSGAEDKDGKPITDKLALLESMRRFADRITVFCDAGQIHVPRRHQLLFAYLEKSVIPVVAPNKDGAFHPKVWVLRFIGPEGDVRYRLLVLSRNLTFDRSWDTVLTLDGQLKDRQRAFAMNHPLGDFISALSKMTVQPISDSLAARIDQFQSELRRTEFDLPEGFEELRFWPVGHDGRAKWPFYMEPVRVCVVSPFLSEGFLNRITATGKEHVLVSRIDSLSATSPACLQKFASIYSLNLSAAVEEGVVLDDPAVEDSPTSTEPAAETLGLHAKVFLAEQGWNTHVFTGSANATDAAISSNIEFMVELIGKRSVVGINQLLKLETGVIGFSSLLVPYLPMEPVESDPAIQKLKERARRIRRQLVERRLRLEVETEVNDAYSLRLLGEPADWTVEELSSEILCWPISVAESTSQKVDWSATTWAVFPSMTFQAITSFLAFQIELCEGSHAVKERFLLNVPLSGEPTNRRERVLQNLLENSGDVLRYILFLLQQEGQEGWADAAILLADGTSSSQTFRESLGPSVLESLLRALSRDPAKLDNVGRLLDDLRLHQDGQDLLPKDLIEIWEPIRAVRALMKSQREIS